MAAGQLGVHMDERPDLTPDGKWRWDGSEWVANTPDAQPPSTDVRPLPMDLARASGGRRDDQRALWIALTVVVFVGLVGAMVYAIADSTRQHQQQIEQYQKEGEDLGNAVIPPP